MNASVATTVLSVRADARRHVVPDRAELHVEVAVRSDSRAAGRAAATAAFDAVAARLRALGGSVRSLEALRAPLTWAVEAVDSWSDGEHVECHLRATVHVRDFDLLPDVGAALSGDGVELGRVSWRLDDDNPVWPQVRADAIASALRKGGDYAAALGGELLSVEQVADDGLLGDGLLGDGPAESFGGDSVVLASKAAGDGEHSTQLHPQPQVAVAVIEARFVASCRPLR
ncbi:SIMPL domain-containing protein [Jatrophihabitans fulvus]